MDGGDKFLQTVYDSLVKSKQVVKKIEFFKKEGDSIISCEEEEGTIRHIVYAQSPDQWEQMSGDKTHWEEIPAKKKGREIKPGSYIELDQFEENLPRIKLVAGDVILAGENARGQPLPRKLTKVDTFPADIDIYPDTPWLQWEGGYTIFRYSVYPAGHWHFFEE